MLVFHNVTNTNSLTILTYLMKCCKNDVKMNIMSKSMFLFDLADISENGTLVCEQKLQHIYDDVFIFNKSDGGKVA